MSVSGSKSVTIAAAPDEVLAVVRDVDGQPTWWPGMLESEVLEQDEDGRVTRARIVNDVKVVKDEFEVTYTHADDAVHWQLAKPSTAQKLQRGAWTLTGAGGSTQATLSLEIETSLPLPGFVQRKVLGDTLKGATAGLKRHCEG
jgi:ribosome-associated toxin RatA of RatAB toxin-antitoxin module